MIYTLIVLVFIIVFSSYFYKFNNGLSSNQAVWGAFGDYVGGLINPLLSFITIIYLIKTYSHQKKETILIQNENKLNNLLKSLESINSDLLNFYEKKEKINFSSQITHKEILDTLWKFAISEVDLEDINNVTDDKSFIDRIMKNALFILPLRDKNISEYVSVYKRRENKLMLQKFIIGTEIISNINKIEKDNPIAKIFYNNHAILCDLHKIRPDYFE